MRLSQCIMSQRRLCDVLSLRSAALQWLRVLWTEGITTAYSTELEPRENENSSSLSTWTEQTTILTILSHAAAVYKTCTLCTHQYVHSTPSQSRGHLRPEQVMGPGVTHPDGNMGVGRPPPGYFPSLPVLNPQKILTLFPTPFLTSFASLFSIKYGGSQEYTRGGRNVEGGRCPNCGSV